MKVLETKDLKKYYGEGATCVKALDGVDFAVEKGEFVAVVGKSGSGKSTLLHMLGGLDHPTSGKVLVDGTDIYRLKKDPLCIFRRRKIGFVFQSYNLVPVLNVYENIVLPIQLDGNDVDEIFVQRVIQLLGLEERLNSLPSQLSGGQQQQVSIGRALIHHPAILLADEPTGNLDSRNTQEIMTLLRISNKQRNQTCIVITHDENIALQADRIIAIEDGRISSDQVIRQ